MEPNFKITPGKNWESVARQDLQTQWYNSDKEEGKNYGESTLNLKKNVRKVDNITQDTS